MYHKQALNVLASNVAPCAIRTSSKCSKMTRLHKQPNNKIDRQIRKWIMTKSLH